MFKKKYCKAIGKSSKRPCHRLAIIRGYCALHQRQKDRGKLKKSRKENVLDRYLRGEEIKSSHSQIGNVILSTTKK